MYPSPSYPGRHVHNALCCLAMHRAFSPQLLGPHTGEQRESTHAALSAHCSSDMHSGAGGCDEIGLHRTSGEPVYPGGHEQTGECRTPVQIALRPHALIHGSVHFLLIQARSPGQSSLTVHS